MQIFVLMGVSGVGKTTLGVVLASRLDLPFFEGDDFHTKENIQKMKSGQPLNDEDRKEWLKRIAKRIGESSQRNGGVFTCSALKEKYRKFIQDRVQVNIEWIYLYDSFETIHERMKARKDHFFKPEMLRSQFDILEPPKYGIQVKVSASPEQTLKDLMAKIDKPEMGIIGLGVMGKSLALNMATNGIRVSVYNREVPGEEEGIARNFHEEYSSRFELPWFNDLKEFVEHLPRPRNILLMVKAGKAVDSVISELLPLLEADDLLLDAGNSHFIDTERRIRELGDKKIHYLGIGISGGEEGARNGPSIMPGGSMEAYQRVEIILNLIAARDKDGRPCCSYIGPEGSGHFVKMLHNGIEYGEMQLIAEFYHFMRFYLKLSLAEISTIFKKWNAELNSYLLGISADILQKEENGSLLLDSILDVAGQKGTGGWSTQAALDLGISLDTITAAVMARNLSGNKERRVKAEKEYEFRNEIKVTDSIKGCLFGAFKAAQVINHSIGFDLLFKASVEYNWKLNLSEIARIWTNGCIIRSGFMESLVEILKENPASHILMSSEIITEIKSHKDLLSEVVAMAIKRNCPMPVSSAAINYLNVFASAQSSANIIQAQRDYFGAHGYERTDSERGEYYHTQWKNTD
ncbi:decarboxylating NADP(+)-dependent phosphogluconate dehydrogenase [Gramella jeungdoensis]|uniref:6-phosphogluconate dehydrogenase, decarboxylating n=1 Tax=Gramella jeungdoensis TaxID=708091 RepID=A0ABT0Z414_9FLAO|nr:decarboxylating NADP(+)-dependent phosphogluconate dehydrogenase [Gramella jeungdoensis]MCM8570145.1 decarboxylating NADP(+)-dependent phosphogluconate dehydrogenase [Gramella jeungdoensis]